MSTTIDSKVVEMSFDNRNFEKNVDQSLGTLDKLKQALKFDKTSKSFDELDKASRRLDFSALNENVKNVKLKFSAMEVMAITALTNITNKAVDTGLKFAKSLSIDQITAGFGKYEEKTTAVQTIMSATAESWKKNADQVMRTSAMKSLGYDEETAKKLAKAYAEVASGEMKAAEAAKKFGVTKADIDNLSDSIKNLNYEGTQMEYIDDQLNKLNWFSDETSYSFNEMTNNIGKFTSNGVGLSDAVEAMEGISVWAAKSGQTSESAARAMYNLAQAYATGSVKLIDWKSIENANMATTQFKETAIQTAVELGTLEETGTKGLYHVKGAAADATVSVTNFNENLSKGWFSSDVLMKTLSEYGKATTLLSDISAKYDVTATSLLSHMNKVNDGTESLADASLRLGIPVQQLTEYFATLNSEEYKLGLESFKMAQEAKTFSEAIDATKDAVSTGWMKTFELIFGNYEEAKKLWTELAERLWDVFAASGETRNAILEMWNAFGGMNSQGGGREGLIEGFWNLWDAIQSVVDPIKEAFGEVFPMSIQKAAGLLNKFTIGFKNLTERMILSEEQADKVKTVFKGLASVVKIVWNVFKAVIEGFKSFSIYGEESKGVFGDMIVRFGEWLTNLEKAAERMKLFQTITDRVSKFVGGLASAIQRVSSLFRELFPKEGLKGFFFPFKQARIGLDDFITKLATFTIPTAITDVIFGLLEALTGKDFTEAKDKVEGFFNSLYEKIFDFIQFVKTIPDTLSGIFQKLTGMTVGDAFTSLSEKLTKAWTSIKDFFANLKKVDYSGADEFAEETEKKFEPITSIFRGLSKVFTGIWEFMKKLGPLFSNLGKMVGDGLNKFGDSIKKYAEESEVNGETVLGLFSGGFLVAIVAGIKSLVDKFSNLTEKLVPFGDKLIGILDGIQGCFEAWQNKIKADMIFKIALAVGIVAAALVALSTVEGSKLLEVTGVITALMFELFQMLQSVNGLAQSKTLRQTTNALVKMAAAILILAFACSMLGSLSLEELGKGLLGVFALLTMMTIVAKVLGDSEKKMIKGGGAMIMFAIAINLLVKPVKELAALKWEELGKGLLAVGVLFTMIGLFVSLVQKSKFNIRTGAAVILLATAIGMLVEPIKELGAIPLKQLGIGLGALAVILLEVGLFANTLGKNAKRMMSATVSMIILAYAMDMLADVIKKLGEIPLETLVRGLGAMAVALLEIVLAMNFLPKGMITKAAGLLIVAEAITILAEAMKNLGGMSYEEIYRCMLALGSGIVILVAALHGMKSAVPGALALIIAAGAIAILTPCLLALSKLSWEEIGKGLVAIAGVFLVFAAAALILTPVVPVMIALALAVALLGAGLALLGAGLLAMASGLALLTVAGVAGIGTLAVLLEVFIGMIPTIAVAVAEAIVNVIACLGESIPKIIKAITKILGAILKALTLLIPQIVGFILTLFVALKVLVPEFINLLLDILIGILKGIAERIDDIVYELIMIIGGIIEGILVAIPDFMARLVDGFIQGIYSFADHIVEQAPLLRDAMKYLGHSMLIAFLELFGMAENKEEAEEMINIGKNTIKSFIAGIKKKIVDAINAVNELVEKIKKKFIDKYELIKGIGSNFINKFKEGFKSKIDAFKEAVTEFIEKIKEWFSVDTWIDLGKNLLSGFIKGMKDKDKRKEVKETAGDVGKDAETGVQEKEEIKSPSRVWTRFGKFMDEGLIIGLNKYSNKVKDAAGDVGESAIRSMNAVVNKMSNTIDDNMDVNPVITPVLDLSEIQNGSKRVGSFFDNQNMNLAFASDGFNYNMQAAASEKSSIVNAINAAIGAYVPQIIEAINDSTTNVNVTADLTPNSKKFYDEMRVQNQIFKRSKGYSGL